MRRIPQYVPLKKAAINERSKARAERYARLFGALAAPIESRPTSPPPAPHHGLPLVAGVSAD